MDQPVYTLSFTLTDMGFQPSEVQQAGMYGDHRAAQLTIGGLDAAYRYRLEIVDGGGAYDVTELLTAPNGTLTYDIPAAWTAPGTARVRVMRLGEERGEDTQYVHFAPILLYFADREDGTAMGEMLPRWQAIMTDMENTIDGAAQAADRASDAAVRVENASQVLDDAEQTAAQALADAKEAQERANTTTGVYVGSGDMPSGYNVQIDPTGESVVMADHIIEQGTSGIWTYRKWASGIAEAWCLTEYKEVANFTTSGNVYVSPVFVENLPSGVFETITCSTVQVREMGAYVVNGGYAVTSEGTTVYNKVYWKVFRHWDDSSTYKLQFYIDVKGRWK